MNHYPAPPLAPVIVERLRRFSQSGATRDELIERMRSEGLSIVPSIRLLSDFCGISIDDAKEAVHFSQTWADCLASNDATHEAAFEAVRQLGGSEVEVDLHSAPADLLQPTR